jgi:uncharacterized protein YlxW (UPF0749 family)
MNPFEMVVIIVAIMAIAGMYKAKHSSRRGRSQGEQQVIDVENQRLREEVTALKDRLAVLERITIEKENSLEREIEQLRDR